MHTVAMNALDTLAGFIHDANVNTVKVTVQCFATVYPLLFRKMYATRQDLEYIICLLMSRGTLSVRCTQRNMQQQWDLLAQTKAKILEFVWQPHAPAGIKISAVKFMQRVILVQTRGPNDPRVCYRLFRGA